MATAQSIIEQVKSGMGPEELARKNSWKDLSGINRDELLKTAVRMEEKQQSYNLLVYLFRISFDKDLWFSTEVLSQAVQHPIMTLLDHQAILPTMRSHLNKIKDEISLDPPPEEKLVKYWLMEANYYAINGNMLAETGKKVEAAQNYQIAQSIFEQLGQFQQASKYKVLSWRIQGNDIQKTPLPKTSPIKFRLPPTQPFNQTFPDYADPEVQKSEIAETDGGPGSQQNQASHSSAHTGDEIALRGCQCRKARRGACSSANTPGGICGRRAGQ